MVKIYILNNIYDFMYKIHGIVSKITKIDDSRYHFNLGNNCAFVLNTDSVKTCADLNAFILELSTRLNNVLKVPA